MKQDELQKVLENHILWLNGKGGGRADLSDADLQRADLSDADLGRATLSDADLQRADLSGATLSDADLRYATLSNANLRYADLSGANLRGADLSGANLRGADLSHADLQRANLRGANLRGANLRGASLRYADIENVQYDESTAFFALQCPEEGSFVGWKKCQYGVIVKLLIPEDAKRSSATSRKCRASRAVVLEVIGADEGLSHHDTDVVYRVGEEVVADSFDDDRWNECSHGVHFFITRKEAENY